MHHWTLDDIQSSLFERDKVDPSPLKIVKTAAMVEYNGIEYGRYLQNVFHDDAQCISAAEAWSQDEVKHGETLRQWVQLAEPGFEFATSFKQFVHGYRLDLHTHHSVRGSLLGEPMARCTVEIGTSSFYAAVRDATEEPVLKQICGLIARNEIGHFTLFKKTMERYLTQNTMSRWHRMKVLVQRISEVSDDEFGVAHHVANCAQRSYDRAFSTADHGYCSLRLYKESHVKMLVGLGMSTGKCAVRRLGSLTAYASVATSLPSGLWRDRTVLASSARVS